jgi:hypothetical protein
MGAHGRTPVPNRQEHHPAGALVNIFNGKGLLQLRHQHLRGRPTTPHSRRAVGDKRLVRVNVGLDKSRQDKFAGDIDGVMGRGGDFGGDLSDAPLLDG